MTMSKALEDAEVKESQLLVTHSIPARRAEPRWRPGMFRNIFSYALTTSSSQHKLPVGSDSKLWKQFSKTRLKPPPTAHGKAATQELKWPKRERCGKENPPAVLSLL